MAQPKKIKHNCRILICIIIIFYQIPTGCSFTEALIDKRLLVELRVQYVKIPRSEHVGYISYSECQNKNIDLGRKFEFRS